LIVRHFFLSFFIFSLFFFSLLPYNIVTLAHCQGKKKKKGKKENPMTMKKNQVDKVQLDENTVSEVQEIEEGSAFKQVRFPADLVVKLRNYCHRNKLGKANVWIVAQFEKFILEKESEEIVETP
jgi:alpha-N-acetylglucosamine transferase